jgi:hypothetical protein
MSHNSAAQLVRVLELSMRWLRLEVGFFLVGASGYRTPGSTSVDIYI